MIHENISMIADWRFMSMAHESEMEIVELFKIRRKSFGRKSKHKQTRR